MKFNFQLLAEAGSNSGERFAGGTASTAFNAAYIRLTNSCLFSKLLLRHVASEPCGNHCTNGFIFRAQLFVFR